MKTLKQRFSLAVTGSPLTMYSVDFHLNDNVLRATEFYAPILQYAGFMQHVG